MCGLFVLRHSAQYALRMTPKTMTNYEQITIVMCVPENTTGFQKSVTSKSIAQFLIII